MTGQQDSHSVSRTAAWIEAIRLRTLPVSVAGVFAGDAVALRMGSYRWQPALICLLFAVLAQISSNFANEYYDYKNGLDSKGRDGFRRGVTEGDISPDAMRHATYGVLATACLLGISLIYWGGWWLLCIGIAVAIFAVGYSAGPYPLSHHGLGDVAVFIFFGLVPVAFTAWLQTSTWNMGYVMPCVAAAIGFMGTNVLIVNNYRDADDDARVGKRTTVVRFGRRTMSGVYLANALAATVLLITACAGCRWWAYIFPVFYCTAAIILWRRLISLNGSALNNVLKFTAISMLITSIGLIPAFALT